MTTCDESLTLFFFILQADNEWRVFVSFASMCCHCGVCVATVVYVDALGVTVGYVVKILSYLCVCVCVCVCVCKQKKID